MSTPINFSKAIFKGDVRFNAINFKNLCKFETTIFEKNVDFVRCFFETHTYFHNAIFKRRATFNCKFEDEVRFNSANFSDAFKTFFIPIKGNSDDGDIFMKETSFMNVKLSDKCKFTNCKLNNVAFADVIEINAEFIACKFQEKNDRLMIYDEENQFKRRAFSINQSFLAQIERTYRQLSVCFKDSGDLVSSNKFRLSEIIIRRSRLLFQAYNLNLSSDIYYSHKFKDTRIKFLKIFFACFNFKVWKNSLIERFLLFTYGLISNYDRSPLRVFLWILFCTCLASLTLLIFADIGVIESLLFPFQAITFQQNISSSSDIANVLITLLRVISVILIPMLILSIKKTVKSST